MIMVAVLEPIGDTIRSSTAGGLAEEGSTLNARVELGRRYILDYAPDRDITRLL